MNTHTPFDIQWDYRHQDFFESRLADIEMFLDPYASKPARSVEELKFFSNLKEETQKSYELYKDRLLSDLQNNPIEDYMVKDAREKNWIISLKGGEIKKNKVNNPDDFDIKFCLTIIPNEDPCYSSFIKENIEKLFSIEEIRSWANNKGKLPEFIEDSTFFENFPTEGYNCSAGIDECNYIFRKKFVDKTTGLPVL